MKLLAVIILEEEEDNDLLVYCMSAIDIFSKRKDEGCYSSVTGRYFMDSEMKYREYFGDSKDIFHLFIL